MIVTKIDPDKNFIHLIEPGFGDKGQEYNSGAIGSKGGKLQYIRWGWFEDNIITRYMSLAGKNDDNPLITFRSIEPKIVGGLVDRGQNESVKIADYYLLRPIDPSHSLIFKPNLFQRYEGTGMKQTIGTAYETYLASINAEMISPNTGPYRGFRVPSEVEQVEAVEEGAGDLKVLKYPPLDEANPNGLGYLRNIYINVDVIQKHFGIEVDAMKKTDEDYGYVTEGVTPKQNIRSSILSLMAEVSTNFFGAWKFQVSEDPENPNNAMLKDLTAIGVSTFSYSTFTDDDGFQIRNQGVYKFPSFKIDSNVRAQELEINIGENLQYFATLAHSTAETVVSSNQDMNKFQRFAVLSRLGANMTNRKDRLVDLYHTNIANPKGGYAGGEANVEYVIDAGLNHADNVQKTEGLGTWWKYAPAFNKSTQSEETEKKDRPIGFDASSGKFEYLETVDLAKAVADNDEAALQAAADALGDGTTVDAIKSTYAPEPPPDPATLVTTDQPIALNESGAVPKDKLQHNEDGEDTEKFETGGEYKFIDKAGRTKEVKGSDVQDVPVIKKEAEEKQKVEVEAKKEASPKPKRVKTKFVTVASSEVMGVYSYSKGKATDLTIERLSLKEFIRKAILTKMNGGGSDAKALIDPFDYVEMSIEIDGIGGIIPGNSFHSDYMPLKYNKPVYAPGGVDVGANCFFVVMEHSSTISDAGWTTQIKGQMSNNPDAQKITAQMTEEKLAQQFKLNARRSFGMESVGASALGKLGKYIDVAGRFLVDAKSYIDENYGNTADGFSLKKYAKNQGIAKELAEAETEEDRAKIISSLDVDIKTIGDYDGGFFKNMWEATQLTVAVGSGAVAQSLGGVGTVAMGAGTGLANTAARLDRDPIGLFPELFPGKATEGETVTEDEGATDKATIPGLDVDGASALDSVKDGVNVGDEIEKANDNLKVNKREGDVALATASPEDISALVDKITFEVMDQSSTPAAGGRGINAYTQMRGKFRGSPIILDMRQTGEGTLTEIGLKNQAILKRDIAKAFFARYPGEDLLNYEKKVEDEIIPTSPFSKDLGENYFGGKFGHKEPKWESAADARAELAAKFSYTSFKNYTEAFDKDERTKHWSQSKELWTKKEGIYTSTLGAEQIIVGQNMPLQVDY